jgi:RNA polymerase sigma factor (sigma-70 family)
MNQSALARRDMAQFVKNAKMNAQSSNYCYSRELAETNKESETRGSPAEYRMSLPSDVLELIPRARSGDEVACAQLVRRIEPFLMRVVRIRMRQHAKSDEIRHDVGSADVCQSVLKSLFQGLRKDRYQLAQPADLQRLLQVMVRFTVASKARRSSVKLRKLMDDFAQEAWEDSAPAPDEQVARRDLIDAIQDQLAEDELEILTLWLDDESWAEIGRKLGCTADAARVRLRRAFARIRGRFGADDHGA